MKILESSVKSFLLFIMVLASLLVLFFSVDI